jgi:uncharacterized coiled-coil protein SlyX
MKFEITQQEFIEGLKEELTAKQSDVIIMRAKLKQVGKEMDAQKENHEKTIEGFRQQLLDAEHRIAELNEQLRKKDSKK